MSINYQAYIFNCKICANTHQAADQVIHSNAKAVELLYASNAADLLKQETHLHLVMVLNVEIVKRTLDD